MKAMNFYTAKGWAGSNYNSKLSTKEIAAKVRFYAKKNFPGFKFSVRSEWGMYTDSMYIELKAGTCVPFVFGSRSAERGYMSTMSTVKGWEDELTLDVFKVLDAVTVYANSFKYDDSDGMQDYYDTNFYIHIKVSDEYKVVEPKAKKNGVKAEKVEEDKEMKGMTVEGIEVVDYLEKAVAVFGDTKTVEDQLKELGGRFNRSLNYNGEKRSGWIFSKKQADKVKELITPTELPALPEEIELKRDIDIEQQEYNASLIIDDFAKYGCVDYLTECEEMGGFKLGELVYDQCGEIGIILAFYKNDGEARLNSNGCCNVGKLKKCPKEIAEREVKHMDIIRSQKTSSAYTVEAYPLENIHLTETGNFNSVYYYDVEGGGIITSAKVRADLSPSSYYKPMGENVEFHEKKVTGKRYIAKNNVKCGYYHVIDTLDNCPVGFFQTREEAEKEAETLNGFTDDNGRLRRII